MSTLAIFVGAIGGVSAYGILGLIIGPVLLSFAVALVRFAQETLGNGRLSSQGLSRRMPPPMDLSPRS